LSVTVTEIKEFWCYFNCFIYKWTAHIMVWISPNWPNKCSYTVPCQTFV